MIDTPSNVTLLGGTQNNRIITVPSPTPSEIHVPIRMEPKLRFVYSEYKVNTTTFTTTIDPIQITYEVYLQDQQSPLTYFYAYTITSL